VRPPDRAGLVIGVALVVALGVGVGLLSFDDPGTRSGEVAAATASANTQGTRPPRLDRHAIERAAAAFGIAHAPKRVASGWEAEDRVRSLYLTKSPSAWYVGFESSSLLLGPLGDRAAICDRSDAPFDCTVPGTTFLADTIAPAPDRAAAARAARRTLARAGLLAGTWRVKVLDASSDVPPCKSGLVTKVDCTRQHIPTRAVMLTHDFGPGKTAARYGVIIGPDGSVVSVTGRFAEPE
jgi:hypothetical protein